MPQNSLGTPKKRILDPEEEGLRIDRIGFTEDYYRNGSKKLPPGVETDEDYYRVTNKRVPWYKPKKETASQQNTREVNEKKILDRRKKPTVEEQEATAITKATGKLDRDAALAEAIAKNRAMIKATEKNRLGPTLTQTAIRQVGEIDKLKDEIYTEDFLIAKKAQAKANPDIVLEPLPSDIRNQDLFQMIQPDILSLQDSVRWEKRAKELGFTNTNDFYSKRNESLSYLGDFNKLLDAKLKSILGFVPATQYRDTPKGQELLIKADIARLRDEVAAELEQSQKYAFDFNQAKGFLDATNN